MRALRIQLVGLRDGRPIGWGRFLIRSLVLAALTVTVVGLVLMLVALVRHPRKQGWHDLVADSVVIRERPLAPRRSLGTRVDQPARTPAPPEASQTAGVTPEKVPETTLPDAKISAGTAPVGAARDGHGPTGRGSHAEAADSKVTSSEESVRLTRPAPASGTIAAPRPQVHNEQPGRGRQDDRPLSEGWVVVLDDGREVPIQGLVLLGRNPQPRPGEEDAELIKVADDTRTVSKTHLSLNVDSNGLYVTDRGSTNGTTLTSTPGSSRACTAGNAVPASGGFVSFGDHWLRIERRSGR
jgi:hypothetical protein